MADREITIKTTIDDVELWKAVWGAGAETWGWWRRFDYQDGADWDKPGTVRVTVLDPNNDEWIDKDINLDDIVNAYVKLKETRSDLDYDNFDANSADLVLQIAVLGEVVYG